MDAVDADDKANPARRCLIAGVVQALLDRETAERIRLHAEWEQRIGRPFSFSQPIATSGLSMRTNLSEWTNH